MQYPSLMILVSSLGLNVALSGPIHLLYVSSREEPHPFHLTPASQHAPNPAAAISHPRQMLTPHW